MNDIKENNIRIYNACGDLWKQRAKLEAEHRTEDICTLATQYIDAFKIAAPLCYVQIDDLEDAGESIGLIKRPLRRIRIRFLPTNPQ
jgi:hypothetical protein